MRTIVIAMGVLVAVGLVAGPQALETFTGADVPGVAGEAAAVWCGPESSYNGGGCCGDPYRMPVTGKEIQNPVQC